MRSFIVILIGLAIAPLTAHAQAAWCEKNCVTLCRMIYRTRSRQLHRSISMLAVRWAKVCAIVLRERSLRRLLWKPQ